MKAYHLDGKQQGDRPDEIQLSSGRRFYADDGVLGLSAFGPARLGEGYDTIIDVEFAPEERQEIAAHMIERWRAWGAAAATDS